MLDKIIIGFTKVWEAIPFTAVTWFVLFTILFFVWLFSKSHRDPNSPIRWEDLIISVTTGRADPYKIGYLVGIIVGTWVVIGLYDKEKLSFDMFGLYLAYLVGGAGWNMVTAKRHGEEGQSGNATVIRTKQIALENAEPGPKLPQ